MSVLEDIFGGLKGLADQAGKLAPTAAAWKELIDPVRAVQQPTLGTASVTPIIGAPATGTVSKTPGFTTIPSTTLLLVGGVVITILIVLLTRKH